MLRKLSWVLAVVVVSVMGGIGAVAIGALLTGCGPVSTEQHLQNAVEANEQRNELDECRRQGREAKKDGGAEAYMVTYEACALKSDRKHGLDGG